MAYGNKILKTLTNQEIRDKHKELGSYARVGKYYGISPETVQRAIWGGRQCPSKREGNLSYDITGTESY